MNARTQLIDDFQAAIAGAALTATNSRIPLDERVHEFRKALRLARALLDLAPSSDPRAMNALRSTLRSARRILSTSRDATAVATALDHRHAPTLDDPAKRRLLATARRAAPAAARTEALLAEAAGSLRDASGRFVRALPESFDALDLIDRIVASYRRTRKAFLRADRKRTDFHRLRRRLKELALQAQHLGRTSSAAHAFAVDMAADAAQLGPIADLLLLHRLAEAVESERTTKKARRRMLAVLHDAFDSARIAALENCAPNFARGGRYLRRRLDAALRVDQELAMRRRGREDSEGDVVGGRRDEAERTDERRNHEGLQSQRVPHKARRDRVVER